MTFRKKRSNHNKSFSFYKKNITFAASIKSFQDTIIFIFAIFIHLIFKIMKKGILLLVSCLFFGVGAKATDPSAANPQRNAISDINANVPVQGVKIQKDGVDVLYFFKVLLGSSPVTLTARVVPDNATNQEVEWSTNSTESFSIDNNGVLTTHKRGGGKVYVKTKDGGFIDSCSVSVRVLADGVGIVGLHPLHHELVKGAELQLRGSVTPSNVFNGEIEWYSEEGKDIVSVDSTGKVKALKVGSSFVIAKTKDGTNLTDTLISM